MFSSLMPFKPFDSIKVPASTALWPRWSSSLANPLRCMQEKAGFLSEKLWWYVQNPVVVSVMLNAVNSSNVLCVTSSKSIWDRKREQDMTGVPSVIQCDLISHVLGFIAGTFCVFCLYAIQIALLSSAFF